MNQKVRIFLHERDRAYARGDLGIIRSMNAELRRLGIKDTATLSDPTGRRERKDPDPEAGNVVTKPRPRGKLQRCEHENVSDRCEICNPELAAQ